MSFAKRIKLFYILAHVHIVAGLALTISALAVANFFGGTFYTYDENQNGLTYSMQAGLFGSCWNNNCNSTDPFYWRSVAIISKERPPRFVGQWTALQAMLLVELGLRATAWLLILIRVHVAKDCSQEMSWTINGINLFAVLCGATTMGLLATMPGALWTDVGGTFQLNTSSILQICAFTIGTLGVFWYALACWYVNKEAISTSIDEVSNTSWFQGQQVEIDVEGKTLTAQPCISYQSTDCSTNCAGHSTTLAIILSPIH